MITCPQCKHQELNGALFCTYCGAQLYNNSDTTATINRSDLNKMSGISSPTTSTFPTPPVEMKDSQVAIRIMDSDEIIFIQGEKDLTIGRSTEGQMIVPDIDLSSHDAYEAGVSRLHANLTISKQDIITKDLGSANGTRLNGQKIAARAEHSIQHGDILTLGKFKIQILIKE
ncbi:MAG: FHA domain-containing protein [Anaerolineales bacterium]|nr:FHA domain-containing protein [Chloroflexota bacterium]MBL6980742.1 FHA domain-containing protein [Anaerolineales bacterium]